MDTEPMICLECNEDMEWEECPECDGEGQIDGTFCTRCYGHGGWFRCPCCGYECDAEGYDL